jgi:hypothetical protein
VNVHSMFEESKCTVPSSRIQVSFTSISFQTWSSSILCSSVRKTLCMTLWQASCSCIHLPLTWILSLNVLSGTLFILALLIFSASPTLDFIHCFFPS